MPLLPPTGALALLGEKTIWKTAFSLSLAPLNANQRRRLKIPSKAGVRTADRENGGAERLQLPGRKRDWRRRAFPKNPLPDLPAPRLRFQPLLLKATAGPPRGVAGPPPPGATGGTTPKLASTPCAAGAAGRGVPRVLPWPFVPRGAPPTGCSPTGVHRRFTKPSGPLGTAAPAGTEDLRRAARPGGLARCIRAADRPQRGHSGARRLAGLLVSARADK